MSSFLGCMLIAISIILVAFSALMLWDMFDDRFDRIICLFIVCAVPLSAIGGAFFHKAMLEEEERHPTDPITWGDLDEVRQLLESSGLENSK